MLRTARLCYQSAELRQQVIPAAGVRLFSTPAAGRRPPDAPKQPNGEADDDSPPAAATGGANAYHRPAEETEARDDFARAAAEGGVEAGREQVEHGTPASKKARDGIETLVNKVIHGVEATVMPGKNPDLPTEEVHSGKKTSK